MPAPVPPNPPPKRSPVPRLPTRLESADEIRATVQARQAELLGGASRERPGVAQASACDGPTPQAEALAAPPAAPGSPQIFRPTRRPPTPLLHVFDDGADDGEILRLRGERFVVGRSEGDLQLPHDAQVSARHAEPGPPAAEDGRWVWVLTDLGSTNSTLRPGRGRGGQGRAGVPDRPDSVSLRGRRAGVPWTGPLVLPGSPKATVAWNSAAGVPVPSVVELTPTGPGGRVPLLQVRILDRHRPVGLRDRPGRRPVRQPPPRTAVPRRQGPLARSQQQVGQRRLGPHRPDGVDRLLLLPARRATVLLQGTLTMKIRLHVQDGPKSYEFEHAGPRVTVGRNPAGDMVSRTRRPRASSPGTTPGSTCRRGRRR